MYKILSVALISVVMLSSCAEKTGMPEFSVFNMSVRNEAVQIPSEGLIDDVSIVKLDNSTGAPVIGIIEDAYESETTSTPRTEVSSGVSAPRAAVPASI